MNQYNQPPRFRQKSSAGKWILGLLCAALLGGAAGYGGSLLAMKTTEPSKSQSGVNITQGSSPATGRVEAVDVSDVVNAVRPTVVEITTESVTSGNSLFGQYISQGAGSGVIMSSDGYIITNNHVVEGARSIAVRTADGTEYDAKLVGTDPSTDLAVIKVDAQDLQPATFGNSNDLKVGSAAIAIGNPLGSLGGTVTTGIISALDREIVIDNETMVLLQTDAAINPGNSGGALFNMKGELVGINSVKVANTKVEGMGYAIPISDIKGDMEMMMERETRPVVEEAERGYLGITGNNVTEEINQAYDIPIGAHIISIAEGSPAEKAGLQRGMIITQIDGKTVQTIEELKEYLTYYKADETITLTVKVRNDAGYEDRQIPVTLYTAEEAGIESDNSQTQEQSGTQVPSEGGYYVPSDQMNPFGNLFPFFNN